MKESKNISIIELSNRIDVINHHIKQVADILRSIQKESVKNLTDKMNSLKYHLEMYNFCVEEIKKTGLIYLPEVKE